MAKKNNTIPSVLSFEKKLVPSEGYMYGTIWQERETKSIPLRLYEKSERGTMSNRVPKSKKDTVTKANLQRVDNCALDVDCDTLKLRFTLKVLKGVETPSSCNNPTFLETYTDAVQKYIEEENFLELATRYAMNIANARFLWRNRLGADHIEVRVKSIHGDEENWTFDAKTVSIWNFNHDDSQINSLSKRIAAALSGEQDFLLLEIDTFAKIGKAQDVYPSQELVFDKGRGEKSKILYEVNGIAGMHSQKIGNALRTIDTWYPQFDDVATGPIAIEPYGAVTSMNWAYREPGSTADFYSLFDKWALGGTLDRKEDEHYVMAVLVRGGVFGGGKES